MNLGGVIYILSDQYILSLIKSNMYEDHIVESYSYTNIQDCIKNMMHVYKCCYDKLDSTNKVSPQEYEKLSLLESAEAMLITTSGEIIIYPDKLSSSDKDYLMWFLLNQRSFSLSELTDIH